MKPFAMEPLRRLKTVSLAATIGNRARALTLLSLLAFVTPCRATVQDLRDQIARETDSYRTAHAEFPVAPKHDFRPVPAQISGTTNMEIPGGVGFGYYFYDASLHWTNSTILDYYIITPATMDGDLNYYLYLTSTCRAQLGTEALVSYYAQNFAGFWVFDWSLTTNQWQVGINLVTGHPEYLTVQADEFANLRPMCHVRNGTFLLSAAVGQYFWENRVWLFNFRRQDWDLVYSHGYTTAILDENLFVSGANHGYWGPIVEVFLTIGTYDNLNPAGFHLTRLFQDGSPASDWLPAANSFSLVTPPFKMLTQTRNRGFVAYTGRAPANLFRINNISAEASSNQARIEINAGFGHDYQLYTATNPAGAWVTAGPSVSGNGGRMQFPVPADTSVAFFRVADSYDSGTLNVTANTNPAGFALDPARGISPTNWVAQPDGRHWDRAVVGLSPSTYTVTFDAVPGLPPLPPQTITVTRGNISQVSADYASPAD